MQKQRRHLVTVDIISESNAFRFRSTSSPHRVLAPVDHIRHYHLYSIYHSRVRVGVRIVSGCQRSSLCFRSLISARLISVDDYACHMKGSSRCNYGRLISVDSAAFCFS